MQRHTYFDTMGNNRNEIQPSGRNKRQRSTAVNLGTYPNRKFKLLITEGRSSQTFL